MPSPTFVSRGSTMFEVIVAMQIIAIAVAGALPLHLVARGIASGGGGAAHADGRARDLAAAYAQSLLESTAALPYDGLRNEATCSGYGPTVAPRRTFPGDPPRPDEPPLPVGVTRAEVVLADADGDAASGRGLACRPRRIVVRVWTAASGTMPLVERATLRAER